MRKGKQWQEFDEWIEWMIPQLIDEDKKPPDLGSLFFQFYKKLDREKKELIHFYWFLADKQRDFMIALNADKDDPFKRKILEMMMTAWIFRANFNL